MRLRLKHDVPITYCGQAVVLPKGATVMPVTHPGRNTQYALASVRLLKHLTGNMHDPKYRYAWVTRGDVEETPR